MEHILTRKNRKINRKINRGPSTRVVRNGNNYNVLTPNQQFENTVKSIEENIPFIFYSITGAMLTINEIENLISDVLPPEALKLLEFNPLDIINYFVGPYGLEQFEDFDEELFSNFAKEHGMEVSMMSSIYKILSEEIPGLNISPRIKKLFGISTKTKTQGGSLFNKDHQPHSTRMSGGTFLGTLLSPLAKISTGVGRGITGVAKRGAKLGPKDSHAFGAAIRWIVVILLFIAFSHQDRVNRFDLSTIFNSIFAYLTSFIFGKSPQFNMVPQDFAQHNENLGPEPVVDMTDYHAVRDEFERLKQKATIENVAKLAIDSGAESFQTATMKSHKAELTSEGARPIVQLLAPKTAVDTMVTALKLTPNELRNAAINQAEINSRAAAASNAEWEAMDMISRAGARMSALIGKPWSSTSAATLRNNINDAQQRIRIKQTVSELASGSVKSISGISSFTPDSVPAWISYNFTDAIEQIKDETSAVKNNCLMPSLVNVPGPMSIKPSRLTKITQEAQTCSNAIAATRSKLSSNPALALPVTLESNTPYQNVFKSMNENKNSHAATSANSSKSSKISRSETLELAVAEQQKLNGVLQALKERKVMLEMFQVLQNEAGKLIGLSNNDDVTAVLQQNRIAIQAIFTAARMVAVNVVENFGDQIPETVYNIIIPSLCRMALRSNTTYNAFIAANNATEVSKKGVTWPIDSNSYAYLGKNYQEEFMAHFVSVKVAADRTAAAAGQSDEYKKRYDSLEASLGQFNKQNVKDKAKRQLATKYPDRYGVPKGDMMEPNPQCNQLVESVFENQIFRNELWPRDNRMSHLVTDINRFYSVPNENGIWVIKPNIEDPEEWVSVQVASKWRKIRNADFNTKLEELMYSQIPLLLLFICSYLPIDSLIKVLSFPLGISADLATLLRSGVQRWTPQLGQNAPAPAAAQLRHNNAAAAPAPVANHRQNAAAARNAAAANHRQNAPAPVANHRQIEINSNTGKLERIRDTLRSQDRTSRRFFLAGAELFTIIDNPQTNPNIKREAEELLATYVPQPASAASTSASSASTNMSARINPLLQLGPVPVSSPLRPSLLGQPVGQVPVDRVSAMGEADRMQSSSSSSSSSSPPPPLLPAVSPLASAASSSSSSSSPLASAAAGRSRLRSLLGPTDNYGLPIHRQEPNDAGSPISNLLAKLDQARGQAQGQGGRRTRKRNPKKSRSTRKRHHRRK